MFGNTSSNTLGPFKFNPFSGLHPEEVLVTLVSSLDIQTLIGQIEDETPKIIQLVGKMGRGKTTHLLYLKQHFPDSPLIQLKKGSIINWDEYFAHNHRVFFIDNIQFLSFFKRLWLYRKVPTLVLSSHHNRNLELQLARRKTINTLVLEGISQGQLETIIRNRIQLASYNRNLQFDLDNDLLDQLIDQYHDDFRGILNHLYKVFQQKNQL